MTAKSYFSRILNNQDCKLSVSCQPNGTLLKKSV